MKNYRFLIALLFFWAADHTVIAQAPESLFVMTPAEGAVQVTLHPRPELAGEQALEFSFGVPWPRDTVTDATQIRVFENGVEIPADVSEVLRWRSLDPENTAESLRATRITLRRTFSSEEPVTIEVRWGQTRTLSLSPGNNSRESWLSIASGSYPDEYPATENIAEPAVYATLPPSWLGEALIRGRTIPVSRNPQFQFFDTGIVGFAQTAVNEVRESVRESELIDYLTQPAPWLFDRASTLYSVYLRTGDVKWLRHAHRATEFYANHIVSGRFDLKPGDLKYAYGRPFLIQALLLGDTINLPKAAEIANENEGSWPTSYTTNRSFWTERHTTYALLSAINHWQVDGNNTSAAQIEAFITGLLDQQSNPPNNWANDGCFLHTVAQHEGNSIQEAACSPWMTALLGEAIWEYYLFSEDNRALQMLSRLADYVADVATRNESSFDGALRPWYLSSAAYTQGDPYNDMEHTCDVAGLTARGLWAKSHLGESTLTAKATVDELVSACELNLDNWYRPTTLDRPQWRLAPPRKFSWWFGTTTDLPWLLLAYDTNPLFTDGFELQ